MELTKTVKGTDLCLGDVVRLAIHKFPDAIVYKILGDTIYLRRPYMANESFSYTGGVITYIGLEDFNCTANAEFKLVYRDTDLT